MTLLEMTNTAAPGVSLWSGRVLVIIIVDRITETLPSGGRRPGAPPGVAVQG